MRELQRKQRIKRLLYSWPSLVVLTVLTFFVVKGALNIMMVERESAERVNTLEEKASVLERREADLKYVIERLQNEEGIIDEIKRKFSATREGEHVAIIVDDLYGATSTAKTGFSWYKRFWDAILFWK